VLIEIEKRREGKRPSPLSTHYLKDFRSPSSPVADSSAIPYSLFVQGADNTCNAVNTAKTTVLWKKMNEYRQKEEAKR
jgi:hypothetical protein